MINHEHGNYKCDYCGGENGEFLTATGNHPVCEENATLIAIILGILGLPVLRTVPAPGRGRQAQTGGGALAWLWR